MDNCVVFDFVGPDQRVALNAAGRASASADIAQGHAQDAANSVASTLATSRLYETTAAGILATVSGEYFSVPQAGDDLLILYKNDGGAAVEINRYPAKSALEAPVVNSIELPIDTGAGYGAIYKGGHLFFHNFQPVSPTGGGNTFAGVRCGNLALTAVSTTGFGHEALRDLTTGSLNSAFGTRALSRVTDGAVNSAFGADALSTVSTGGYNNAFGCKALANNTTGSNNNCFGQSAMMLSDTGNGNCAFGQSGQLANSSGDNNCSFGNEALVNLVSGSDNCAFGRNALYTNKASSNNAFGKEALFYNTTGTFNCAFGTQALYYSTTGSQNSALGSLALHGNVAGSYNTAQGWRAGYGAAGDEATTVDTHCTFLGAYASRKGTVPTATVLTNATAVGHDAKVSKSNQIVLGDNNVTELVIGGLAITKAQLQALLALLA